MAPAIDVERLNEASLHDPELLVQLVSLFLDDSSRQIRALASAVEAADAMQASSAAHRIGGAAGNLGAVELCRICRRLETMAVGGWSDAITEAAARVGRELQRTASELEAVKARALT